MANKKNSVKKTTQKTKKTNTKSKKQSVKQVKSTSNYSIFKIIVAILLIAIFVFLLAKSCAKEDEKGNENEEKINVVEKIEEDDLGLEVPKEETKVVYTQIKPLVVEEEVAPTAVVNEVKEEVLEEPKEEAIVDTTSPVVAGVQEGVFSSVTIDAIDDVTDTSNLVATIDEEPYELGTEYSVNGDHVLVITDEAGNSSVIEFTIATIVDANLVLQDVIANTNEGDIIYIEESVTSTSTIVINKSLTIRSKQEAVVSSSFDITAGDVTFDGVTIANAQAGTNNRIINVATEGSFVMENCTFESNTARNGIFIENASSVIITGNEFKNTYAAPNMNNLIEFGGDVPNGTEISNNKFYASAGSNNLISLYNYASNGVVNINNNYFEKSANAIRLANRNNATVTINITGNKYDATDDTIAYAGLVLIQPWVNTEDFTNMTININNLTGPGGVSMTTNIPMSENQVFYKYNTTSVPTIYIDGTEASF